MRAPRTAVELTLVLLAMALAGRSDAQMGSLSVPPKQPWKPRYSNMASGDALDLSDPAPRPAVNLRTGRETWLAEPSRPERRVMDWETGTRKSYLIPAVEIPVFILLVNGFDRLAYPDAEEGGKKVFSTTPKTFWDHVIHGPWGLDRDPFAMNQFAHPYQGSMYHGFARSAGLGYWTSLLYTNVGSFLWETGGETTHPSINDQIASGIGGSYFGEALFRMASLMFGKEGNQRGFWRELGAALISPATGFNRLAGGERFKPGFPSRHPATLTRLRIGASVHSHLADKNGTYIRQKTEVTAEFSMSYGLPGRPGYRYNRPFDYFHFEFVSLGNKDNPFDDITLRGLLLGKNYAAGESFRGIWGLYGGYDYISPRIFRISTTALAIGTTYQWWLSRGIALQGSALAGGGYAAGGNVAQVGERDYHYGLAPQALVGLRLILGTRAMLDVTGRGYYLAGVGGEDPGGAEAIARLSASFTLRLFGHQAIGVQYITSIRDARYPGRDKTYQTTGTISVVYSLLGKSGFGAVEWRGAEAN